MDIFQQAAKQLDATGNVCQLNHMDAPYQPVAGQLHALGTRALEAPAVRAIADQYLHDAMPHLGLNASMFSAQGVAMDGSGATQRLVYHDEKSVMGNATVTYDQTINDIPVWESGIVVQVEEAPMQVIGSQSTVKRDLQVRMPPPDAQFAEQRLDADALHNLLGIGLNARIEINHKERFIYQFLSNRRLEVHREGPTDDSQPQLPFALPPVAEEIEDGAAYVVTAAQFMITSDQTGEVGWLALIEPMTGSVLLLRSLEGCAVRAPLIAATNEETLEDHHSASHAAASGRPPVVFFDIGDTLGQAIFSNGQLARIEIFPAALEVVKELSEKQVRVGIISDPGSINGDLVTSLLQDTGIFAFVDTNLVVYGPKNSPIIFADAASLAGVATSECVFVGENLAERNFAMVAGYRAVATPDHVFSLVDPTSALAWVYLQDPRTKAGFSAPAPNANAQELDRFRDLVSLVGLTHALPGTDQTLAGQYVHMQDVDAPSPTLPSSPAPGDFRFSVTTNDFGAVNAYHNCDRLFRILEGFGIDVGSYFDGTRFPVRVDHRVQYPDSSGLPTANSVNASAPGFRFPPSSDGFRFALAALNTSVGMASDWRVVVHEFGHALLWDHVGSPNFRFAHSAGDALAAILNDPGNRAPRHVTFPWVGIGRSHQRPVSDHAWYGTRYDPFNPIGSDRAGYVAEQMLSSTLFRVYQAVGGDSSDRKEQDLAAAYVAFLIIKSIGLMSPVNNPDRPEGYADLLMQADSGNFQFRSATVEIGVLRKVIRWAFEMQGAFRQPPGFGESPTNQIGNPPQVDVFINDGRDGQYQYADAPESIDIWNRKQADDGAVHQAPVAGRDNFAYVRVSNRGFSAAENVVVSGFQSSFVGQPRWPNDWQPLADAQHIHATAIPSSHAAVVGPFRWVPQSVSPTVLMSVSANGDQSNLNRFSLANPIENRRLVPLDNNVAQRSMPAVMHPTSVV